MATRSAQIVRPYVAFSMLQPVTTVPSAVSSAAPTLKCENAAEACSRARRAAATSSACVGRPPGGRRSETANDPLQQRDELPAHAPRGLHHLGVIERLRQDAGGHVGDARNPEYLDAHMPR